MAQVIWSPYSVKRLDEIGDYIAEDSPVRAYDFVIKLMDSAKNLIKFPNSGSVVPENENFRQVVCDGYRIIYRAKNENIEIVTIISPGLNFNKDIKKATE